LRITGKSGQPKFAAADAAILANYRSMWIIQHDSFPPAVKVAVAMHWAWNDGRLKRIVVTVGEKIGKEHLTYAQGAAARSRDGHDWRGGWIWPPGQHRPMCCPREWPNMAANRSGIQLSTVRTWRLHGCSRFP